MMNHTKNLSSVIGSKKRDFKLDFTLSSAEWRVDEVPNLEQSVGPIFAKKSINASLTSLRSVTASSRSVTTRVTGRLLVGLESKISSTTFQSLAGSFLQEFRPICEI